MVCRQCGASNIQEASFCSSCGARLSLAAEAVSQSTSSMPEVLSFAGFWWRALALVIDTVLCQLASIIIVLPLGFALGVSMSGTSSLQEIEAAGEGLGFVLGILIHWLWFTLSESSVWQASVGKKMLGLTVTDEKGDRIGFGKANARYWSKILSSLFFLMGFIMAAFTQRKQGLHDKIAGTLVIRADV